MKTSETTSELFTALSEASAELENPVASETAQVKTKTGADYSYKYASLADLASQVRTCLSGHGLAVIQAATSEDGADRVGVNTRIVHSSGEWIETGILYLPCGGGAQDYGSAITYARRYALTSALLLAADDDDGAKAQEVKRTESARVSQPQAKGSGERPDSNTSGGGRTTATGSVPDYGGSGPSPSPTELELGGGGVLGKDDPSSNTPEFSKTCAHKWKDAPRAGWEACELCGNARKKEKASL